MKSASPANNAPTIQQPSGLTTTDFWKGYWLTLRPYLFFVSGTAGLLGLALAPELNPGAKAIGFLAFFFSYGLGQAVTDTFQTDTDSISSPCRPMVQGTISQSQVLVISLVGLFLCTLILAWLNPATIILAILCILGLVTYTWFKRRWWGGPFWNSWIVALLPLIGFLCGVTELNAAFLENMKLLTAMASVFFGYAVFVLLGYFKDISADRDTGYFTLPVVAGWKKSVGISAVLAFATFLPGLVFILLTDVPHKSGYFFAAYSSGLLIWVIGVVLLGYAHVRMFKLRDENEAYLAIVPTVKGFILIHLGLTVLLIPVLILPALLYYALFEISIAFRPDHRQI